jgi:hypothetical protein
MIYQQHVSPFQINKPLSWHLIILVNRCFENPYGTQATMMSTSCSDQCPIQIQIWLAMAYEANRRHKDCIALYKELENSHPMFSIRRQAAELRYISEAPKLKISNDEVVTIPQIGSSWDWLVFYLRLCCLPSLFSCRSAMNFNFCMYILYSVQLCILISTCTLYVFYCSVKILK